MLTNERKNVIAKIDLIESNHTMNKINAKMNRKKTKKSKV